MSIVSGCVGIYMILRWWLGCKVLGWYWALIKGEPWSGYESENFFSLLYLGWWGR